MILACQMKWLTLMISDHRYILKAPAKGLFYGIILLMESNLLIEVLRKPFLFIAFAYSLFAISVRCIS